MANIPANATTNHGATAIAQTPQPYNNSATSWIREPIEPARHLGDHRRGNYGTDSGRGEHPAEAAFALAKDVLGHND